MTRFFTTLEGQGKGTRRPLSSGLMILGRSKNADIQIDDSLVSRMHLEVRIEGDTVFVENKSTQGSFLNGKPLVGVVSLNSGDVLDIGHTKLRYEELADEAPRAAALEAEEEMSAEIDGTRIAAPGEAAGPVAEKEERGDETRAVASDHTRMLNPSELPNWAAQEKKATATPARKGMLVAVLGLVVAVLAFGGFFLKRDGSRSDEGATIEYSDSLYGFSLERPLDWFKTTDQAGVIEFGSGDVSGPDWVRLSVRTDKDAAHVFTGITDGFNRYQEILRERYPGFELLGFRPMSVNGAMLVFYAFSTPKAQGKGIFVLNAEARIVAECVSAVAAYGRYAQSFTGILGSFHLTGSASQQVIDFPLPDDGMKHLALADATDLARSVAEHVRLGDMLFEGRDVRPDNRYNAVQEYRRALQLAIAPPRRLDSCEVIAGKLVEATKEYNRMIDKERFEISRALSNGDNDNAYWNANRMMQMVPDKTDADYQEARRVLESLQRPKG
jgi:FHA domain